MGEHREERKKESKRDRKTQNVVEEQRGWGPRSREGRRRREDGEEEPLLQPSAELRNSHTLGLVAACARRPAPAPRDQWRRRGVAFVGVEYRRGLRLCSSRGHPL